MFTMSSSVHAANSSGISNKKPLIYLKDIRHKKQEMIIKLINLGQCEVRQGDMVDFLITEKELKINVPQKEQ